MRARLFLGWVLLLLAGGNVWAADDDNAAVHYRKAFALLPELSEAETTLLDDLPKAPLDDKSRDLLKRSESALEELRRAASLRDCNWGIEISEKWFDDMGPIQRGARRLGQLGSLKSRSLFEQNQAAAALDQFADVMTLARHVGEGGPYISWLVEAALERIALDGVAAYLPQQNAETLKALGARLDAMPKPTPLSAAVRKEKDFLLRYVRPQFARAKTVEEIRNALKRVAMPEDEIKAVMKAANESVPGLLKLIDDESARYLELSPIADLPPAQFRQGLATFEKKYPPTNPLAKDLVTQLDSIRYAAALGEARLAMLRAAIVLQRDGMEKFKAIKDPYGDGPFEHKALKGGFELRSAVHLHFKDKPIVTLIVGRPTKE